MKEFIIAQILALVACGISCASYLFKKKTHFLLFQIAVNAAYCIQYCLLNAPSGAVNNGVFILKYIIFFIIAYKNLENPKWLMFLFCGFSVVFGTFAISEWYTVIPIIASVLFTYALWQDSPVVLRITAAVCDVMWILFNILTSAYVLAVYSAVELVFIIVTMAKLIKNNSKISQNLDK